MSARTKQDKKDLQKARDDVSRLKEELQAAEVRLMLHEAARSNNERPPKHIRFC